MHGQVEDVFVFVHGDSDRIGDDGADHHERAGGPDAGGFALAAVEMIDILGPHRRKREDLAVGGHDAGHDERAENARENAGNPGIGLGGAAGVAGARFCVCH